MCFPLRRSPQKPLRGSSSIFGFPDCATVSCAALILDNTLGANRHSFRTLLRNLFLLKPIHGRFDDSPFEAAVSLTASIATSLASNEFAVDIFAAGSEIHHFRTGRNHMTREAFLDLLASLEPAKEMNRFRNITPEDIRSIASSGAVFLVLLSIDPESEKLYRALAGTGVPIRTFLISSAPGRCGKTITRFKAPTSL